MKLTRKDAEFLSKLKMLVDEKVMKIELRQDGRKRLVLRKNYGDRVEAYFGMTRQGVRWRFQRLMNEIYQHAYLTILFIESNFGTGLRQDVMAIAREQAELHRRAIRIDKDALMKSPREVVSDREHEN
jgi:hypothetical protein